MTRSERPLGFVWRTRGLANWVRSGNGCAGLPSNFFVIITVPFMVYRFGSRLASFGETRGDAAGFVRGGRRRGPMASFGETGARRGGFVWRGQGSGERSRLRS